MNACAAYSIYISPPFVIRTEKYTELADSLVSRSVRFVDAVYRPARCWGSRRVKSSPATTPRVTLTSENRRQYDRRCWRRTPTPRTPSTVAERTDDRSPPGATGVPSATTTRRCDRRSGTSEGPPAGR